MKICIPYLLFLADAIVTCTTTRYRLDSCLCVVQRMHNSAARAYFDEDSLKVAKYNKDDVCKDYGFHKRASYALKGSKNASQKGYSKKSYKTITSQ